jgi:hypothetical protein
VVVIVLLLLVAVKGRLLLDHVRGGRC